MNVTNYSSRQSANYIDFDTRDNAATADKLENDKLRYTYTIPKLTDDKLLLGD